MKMIPLILTVFLCAVAAKAEPAPTSGDKQISCMSADAEILVKPDRAHLTLGVSERSKDLRAAKERMSETLKKAIAFCRANGIQDKHIRTSYISIYPDYRYDDDKAKTLLRHYALTQSFTVTLEDPDKYETILYALLEMGINTVQNVAFTTSELRTYKDKARLAAVQAAQEKAKLLTDAVGITLGKIINIQDSQDVDRQIHSRSRSARSQDALFKPAPSPEMNTGEGFAPGMIPVSAGATVCYELE